MSASVKSTFAWEPLTPHGVAAFAHATPSRLFLVQFIFSLLAAVSVGWFVYDNCFPTLWVAVHNLPPQSNIRSAMLNWRSSSPRVLGEDRFLALVVDLNHSSQIRLPSDVQVEFGRETIRVISLLGYAEWDYPHDSVIPFNRTELEPLWGAWSMELLLMFGIGLAIVFMLTWSLLATIYFVPVRILGFLTNRALNFRQSWRLSGAALMPGVLLMVAAILLYDSGFVDLVSLVFAFAAYFVIGWIYLFVSLLFVPHRLTTWPEGNPFAPRN